MVIPRRTSRGWTLVELLTTLSILGLLVLIITPLIVQASRFFLLSRAKVEIQRDARAVLEMTNRFLRQANYATVVVDQVAGQPSHSRISFTTQTGQNMVFYQQNNFLYHTAATTTVLSRNLRFIAFSYPRSDDPTILSVAVTMEKSIFEGRRKALELSIEKVRVMN